MLIITCDMMALLLSSKKQASGVEFCRSERLAKYNQLLRIEEELGSDATYAGDNWRHISW